MSNRTNTTGLELPDTFSTVIFDAVSKYVADHSDGHESSRKLFAASWNGIGYRFRAAHDYNTAFINSVILSSSPGGEERYQQDHSLFGFATSALSSLECFYFGVYCIGNIIDPLAFPISQSSDLKFYPNQVSKTFQSEFSSEPLCDLMSNILKSPTYSQLKDLRDFLNHRGTLLRSFVLGTNENKHGAFVASNPKDISQNWSYDKRIDSDLTQSFMGWLVKSLNELISETNNLVQIKLK